MGRDDYAHFDSSGYEVAIDDVFEPGPARTLWLPELSGLDVRLVVLPPPLPIALSRGSTRSKRVLESHVRNQHAALSSWPASYRLDNDGLSPEATLDLAKKILEAFRIHCAP